MTNYTSSVNPTLPAMDAPISSSPVRENFASAYSDINFIYSLIAAIPIAQGTVTSVSGINTNGITWSVENPTTAATITISLGAITPSSVAATGNVSGTTLTSTVATGTAPFTVSSTTPVANLSIGGNAATVTTINGKIAAGSNVTITGSGTSASPYNISSTGTPSSAFSALTSGTNTSAAMVVGSGASFAASGSGTITPTTINGLISASTNISITGSGTVASPYSISASSSAGSAFNSITSGTNTTAAMVVGSGGSLGTTGSGTIQATTVTTNANLTGPITSVGNATAIANSVAGTGLTNTANVLSVNTSQDITTLSNLTSNGIVTTSGGTGTLGITSTTGSGNVVLATSPTISGATLSGSTALGTPASGTLTNCTFPTLNQNTTGSAASLSISGQTGLMSVIGLTSTNRVKTVRDAADTLLELGGSYTPTGTWTNMTLANPALGTPASGVLTNCTGTASGLTAGHVTTNANLTGPITSSGNATSINSQTGTGSTFAMSASPTFTGTVNNAGEIITSTSSAAFAVGANGSTNPSLKIDNSVTSAVTGVVIQGQAGGGGVIMQSMDPSSNTSSKFYILPTSGTNGGVGIGMTGSQPTLGVNGGVTIATVGQGYDSSSGFMFNNGAFGSDNNLTAGANVPYAIWFSSSRGHATGALALQTDFLIEGATDTFNGASTMTNGATLGLTYKSCGTNGTCTNMSGLYIPTSAITGTVTNSYGIDVTAATGASGINAAMLAGDGTNSVRLADGTNAITVLSGNVTSPLFITKNNAVTVTSNAGTCPVTSELNTFTNSSAATMAITLATSGAVDGQQMIVRIYDSSASAQTIGWTNTENSTVSVPTTSNGSATLPLTVTFMYNSQTSKWRCVSKA